MKALLFKQKIKWFIYLSIIVATSCVSKDKYDEAIKEKEALYNELQDIKFGVPNLLSDAKSFVKSNDLVKAKEKIKILIENHPNRPETAEAKQMLNYIEEEESWNNAIESRQIMNTEIYIRDYPNGKYRDLASSRLKQLTIENEKIDYENAVSNKSSASWKSFILKYPNRSDIEKIKELIIKYEVEEIMGDRATGELPTSNQIGYGNSSSSTVSIRNDTECELIVRYSGSSIKQIYISAGETRSVELSSGSYKIAASACGYNYAGIEQISGNYSSKYYITTSRY